MLVLRNVHVFGTIKIRLGRRDRQKLSRVFHESFQSDAGAGTDQVNPVIAFRLDILFEFLELTVRFHHVRFIGDHDLRARSQNLGITFQLFIDLVKILNRIAALGSGNIHDVDQDSGPFGVA
ncbi:hypothetical protein SDC9_166811 [bioreactor metagenome]|uniref:Uncharacterized protein n=1 Tax=bioreactor metagenome TaxID=1076179 RepID=A0A645G0H6_9ZZZZ